MSTKKYKELNIKEKLEVAKFLETHSERKAAKHFGISKTTAHNLKKRKHEFASRMEIEAESSKRKMTKRSGYEDVNNATYLWFKKLRSINARISGPMIQRAALKFAGDFNCPDFKASNGWLNKFTAKRSISYKMLSGESNSVPQEVIDNFKERIAEFTAGYKTSDIFNADECGLFFKALPDRSFVLKGDTCKSGKLSKERFTVLLCASCEGEKLQPLVIGKSRKPRAFKNMKLDQLPVIWRNNQKAWMTSSLFEEWLQTVDKQMKKARRNILLIVDNCPAHNSSVKLTNVNLKFLPPNTTSVIQPMDQGIIKNFKQHYRNLMMTSIISQSILIDATLSAMKINALQSINWMDSAWKAVTAETICNCFKKAGFILNNELSSPVLEEDVTLVSDFTHYENMDEFVGIDDHLCICEQPDLSEIHQDVVNEINGQSLEFCELSDSDNEEDLNEIAPKEEEIANMLRNIKNFALMKCADLLPSVQESELVFQRFLVNNNQNFIQTTIDKYFTSK